MSTFRPTSIYIEIDVSGMSLIGAEKYYRNLREYLVAPVECHVSAELRMVADA